LILIQVLLGLIGSRYLKIKICTLILPCLLEINGDNMIAFAECFFFFNLNNIAWPSQQKKKKSISKALLLEAKREGIVFCFF
jgi:hypothetical protein